MQGHKHSQEDKQLNLGSDYEFLIKNWKHKSNKQSKVENSSTIIDTLNKRVQALRQEVTKKISLEEIGKIHDSESFTEMHELSQRYQRLKHQYFLIEENRKKNQQQIRQQKSIILKLQCENHKKTTLINAKNQKIKLLEKQIRNLKQQKQQTELKHTNSSSTDEDLMSQQCIYISDLIKVTIASRQIAAEKEMRTQRTLAEIMKFLQQPLSCLKEIEEKEENLIETDSSIQIMSDSLRSSILTKNNEDTQSTYKRNSRMSTSSTMTLMLSPDKKKRFHRSPVIDRAFILRNRVFQKH